MKKSVLIALFVLSGSFAHAQLDSDCKISLYSSAQKYNEVATRPLSSEFNQEDAMWALEELNTVAQIQVRTCVGIALVQMQHSFRGKLGLISQDEIERKSTQVAQEAISYYKSLLRK